MSAVLVRFIYWTELTCKWTQFIIGDYVIQATAAPSVGVSPHHNRFLQFFLPLGILGISSSTLTLWPWHHVVLCNCFHVFGRSFVLQRSTQHTCIHVSYGSSVQVPQNPSPWHILLLNQQTGRESTMYRKLDIKKMYIIWKIRVTMYQKLVRKTRTMLNYLLSYHSISFVAFCWAINFHKYINYKFYLISIHIRINTCSRKRTLHMT